MSTLTRSESAPAEAEAPELEDVLSVTVEVWAALVGETEPLLPRPVPPGAPFDADGAWSATVTVNGAWQGVITLELAERVARELTAQMLALPAAEDVADGDVADAVGELVNMVGGNLKSLMAGPSALSLPSVAAGRAAFARDVHEVSRLDVLWRGAPVRVCVHVPVRP